MRVHVEQGENQPPVPRLGISSDLLRAPPARHERPPPMRCVNSARREQARRARRQGSRTVRRARRRVGALERHDRGREQRHARDEAAENLTESTCGRISPLGSSSIACVGSHAATSPPPPAVMARRRAPRRPRSPRAHAGARSPCSRDDAVPVVAAVALPARSGRAPRQRSLLARVTNIGITRTHSRRPGGAAEKSTSACGSESPQRVRTTMRLRMLEPVQDSRIRRDVVWPWRRRAPSPRCCSWRA